MGKIFKRCKRCIAWLHKTSKRLFESAINKFKTPLPKPVPARDCLCKTCFSQASLVASEPLVDIKDEVVANTKVVLMLLLID